MNDAAVDEAVEAGKTGRTAVGVVVSNKMDKTITVSVERQVKHPVYGKYIRRRSKLHAHDENNECNIGDKVTVKTSKPISKLKSWVLQSIDERVSIA